MHAGGILLTVDRPAAPSDYVASLRRRDRTFWIAFACAMCAHALIILGMLLNNSNHRTVGSPEGANDAIAVEIVDGATLKDSMEPPAPPAQPPGSEPQQQAARAQPQQEPQPPVEQQPPPEPQAEPQPPEEAVPPPPTPEASQPAQSPPTPDPAEKLAAEALPAFEEAPAADALQMPKPQEAPKKEAPSPEPPKEAQKAEPKKPPPKQQAKQQPQKQPQKRTQTSALDLAVPYDGAEADSDAGNSSAVQRPPGITRSGENDEFARNVIRALQKTMPHVRARSRVTVKIVLNENGSRADVKLMKSGGDPDLDFNVMFAARQTAYPFPPKNSTLVDRTFTVTYIYR
ncbi:energy transducer TonB [Sphingosinicella sp.]|uniref:energy transducer TonB family protein n=1 Tax=Sphingosinicella sp. TaxID=1917971 RepID=UPI0026322DDD|nr:energy transducer TonB [Sphingosinicella sp.]